MNTFFPSFSRARASTLRASRWSRRPTRSLSEVERCIGSVLRASRAGRCYSLGWQWLGAVTASFIVR
eukprot:521414-Amorphochlora_amoeboformis.AAC.1